MSVQTVAALTGSDRGRTTGLSPRSGARVFGARYHAARGRDAALFFFLAHPSRAVHGRFHPVLPNGALGYGRSGYHRAQETWRSLLRWWFSEWVFSFCCPAGSTSWRLATRRRVALESRSLGREKLAFAAASMATGSAISLAGPVLFVGLMVPHLLRLILGTRPPSAHAISRLCGRSVRCPM